MMKQKTLFIAALLLLSSFVGYSQIIKTVKWAKHIAKVQKQNNLSYTATYIDYWGTGEVQSKSIDNYVHFYYKNTPTVYAMMAGRTFKVNKDSIVRIDDFNEEVTSYYSNAVPNKSGNSWYNTERSIFGGFVVEDIYSVYGAEVGIIDRIIKDTLINGVNYQVFYGLDPSTYYLPQGEGFEIDENTPSYRMDFTAYLNRSTDLLDSIVYSICQSTDTALTNEGIVRKTVQYTNVRCEDRTAEMDSIFSYRNPKYSVYEHGNDTRITSSHFYPKQELTELNDTILDFPLISPLGDTTTLREQEGWVLVQSWFYSCSACKDWQRALAEEEKQKGYTDLEKAGIKIMCLNIVASDVERMVKSVEEYGGKGRIYSAKAMNKVFELSPAPSYYLISPDKKIVYKSIGKTPKDNSEFLRLVKEYRSNQDTK